MDADAWPDAWPSHAWRGGVVAWRGVAWPDAWRGGLPMRGLMRCVAWSGGVVAFHPLRGDYLK